jgi:hypothetical protein
MTRKTPRVEAPVAASRGASPSGQEGMTIETLPSPARRRLLHRVSTGIIAALMATSALFFALDPAQRDAFARLGLPDWFRVELTVAKLLGVVALVLPATPPRVREFAYFGFALTLVSADIAHLASGDPVWFVIPHALFLATLAVSYRTLPPERGRRR